MDMEGIGKLLGGVLTGGVAGSVASALAEGLKLANHLMEPNPAKRAKVRRDYYLSLLKIVTEAKNADSKDVTDLITEFTTLLNE